MAGPLPQPVAPPLYGTPKWSQTEYSRIWTRWNSLKTERTSWWKHWQEITDFCMPRRGRYIVSDRRDRGRKKNNNILNNRAIMALRTLRAGMTSGLTNPARPWFRYGLADRNLMEYGAVREWLELAQEVTLRVLAGTNFYNGVGQLYIELGAFGTGVFYREEDFEDVMRYYPFTAGEYAIADNDEYEVDTVYREFTMTAAQMVRKFGWEDVSPNVRTLYNSNNHERPIQVIHAIEPNPERVQGMLDHRGMPFRSTYIERGGGGSTSTGNATPTITDYHGVLSTRGYRKQPFYGVRWDLLLGDTYGRSPAMDALGDVKQLQFEERRKAMGIDKMVNPPMTAPTSLRGKPQTTVGGGVTYFNQTGQSQGFAPAYETKPDLQYMILDIEKVEARINEAFYADLFRMMIDSDRREITATEVAVKQQEKLILLGPVLQQLNTELFDPLITDVFDRVLAAGMLPPPPPQLVGMDFSIEYISLLQQAQQAVGIASLERLATFTLGIAEGVPTVLDKVDWDEAVETYGDVLGAPASVIKDDQRVAEERAQRAAQVQQQQQLEQTSQAADAARTLSETDTSGRNALTDLAAAGTA